MPLRSDRRHWLQLLACGLVQPLAALKAHGADAAAAPLVATLSDGAGVVRMSGQDCLVGELAIANEGAAPLTLRQLSVHAADRAEPAARLDAEALLATAAGSDGRPARTLEIAPGGRLTSFLWLPLGSGAPRVLDLNGSVGGETKTVRVPFEPQSSFALQAPLSGGPWVAVFDPVFPFGHRRSVFTRDGERFIPARYAVDWIRLDERGSPWPVDRRGFADWHGLNAEVRAVADGDVVMLRDGRDDVLASARPAGTWAPDDVAGNHIALRIAPERLVFYEHLAKGSVAVRIGERVRAGQVIGRVGRSGVNSSGPHLHFHVADRPALLHAQGRPWTMSGWRLLGRYASMDDAESGRAWTRAEAARMPRDELPPPNAVLMFDA